MLKNTHTLLKLFVRVAIISIFTSIAMAGSLTDEQWEELKSQGYIFLEAPEFHNAFAKLNEEADEKFDDKIVAKSFIERAVPKEELKSRSGQPFQRDSWFLSRDFTGPFTQKIVHEAFDSVTEIWEDILKRLNVPYTPRQAMGFHRYLSANPGEGLREHKDAGLITILASTQSLEGYINGSWQEVKIPEGHVMVFLGNLLNLFDSKYNCLLHRVPHVKDDKKLSLNVVIDPCGSDSVYLNGRATSYNVGAYLESYFSTEPGKYENFFKNLSSQSTTAQQADAVCFGPN